MAPGEVAPDASAPVMSAAPFKTVDALRTLNTLPELNKPSGSVSLSGLPPTYP